VRLVVTAVSGVACALWLPGALGVASQWGAVGLTASAGIAGWIEFYLLRRTMNAKLGATGVGASTMLKLWSAAGLAAAIACTVEYFGPVEGPIVTAVFVLGSYGIAYFAATFLLRIKESEAMLARLSRRIR